MDISHVDNVRMRGHSDGLKSVDVCTRCASPGSSSATNAHQFAHVGHPKSRRRPVAEALTAFTRAKFSKQTMAAISLAWVLIVCVPVRPRYVVGPTLMGRTGRT